MTAPANLSGALKGIRVLVTRPAGQDDRITGLLQGAGAEVAAVPAIRIQPVEEPAGIKQALANLAGFDGLVFTSANAVGHFLAQMERAGIPVPEKPPALCVGPKTADAWVRAGGVATLSPERFTAADLVTALDAHLAGRSYLVLRPEVVSTDVGRILAERGAAVTEVILYRTEVNAGESGRLKERIGSGQVDVLVYASPSAVRGTVIMAGGAENLAGTISLCIGPTTAEAARRAGLDRIHYPEEHTAEGMVRLLAGLAGPSSPRR